jgi:hypothetical protein
LTRYLSPGTRLSRQLQARLLSDPLFDTDTYTGFSGGDIAPFIPAAGSRVRQLTVAGFKFFFLQRANQFFVGAFSLL